MYVAESVSGGVLGRSVKARAVVGNGDGQGWRFFELCGERHVMRLGMARDVAEGFLHDAVKLNLFDLGELQAVFEIGRAIKLISKFFRRRQLGYGVAQGPFERRQKADVRQHRRAEVFANVANLVRDAFDLAPHSGGRERACVVFWLRQLIGQHQQVAQV